MTTHIKQEKAQEVFDAAILAETDGDPYRALRLFAKAAGIDPDAAHVRVRWASLLHDEGRWKEAIQVTRQLIKSHPRLYLAHRLLAVSYDELGRPKLAERAYKQSLAIKQCPISWVLLGSVLGRLKRYDEVEGCLRKALKVDPDYEEAHYNLGYIYRHKGRRKLAEKHLRRAIEIDRNYVLAYAELGQLLSGSGRNDRTREAVRLLKKAVGYNSNDGWSRAYLANGLWTLRRLKAAEAQYRGLIEVWPDRALPYWCYGNFLAYENKDISTAEAYLRKAIQMDPKDGVPNYSLGKHLLYWDRKKEAKRFLTKAAKLGNRQAVELLQSI